MKWIIILILSFSGFYTNAQRVFGINVTPVPTTTYRTVRTNIWDTIGLNGKYIGNWTYNNITFRLNTDANTTYSPGLLDTTGTNTGWSVAWRTNALNVRAIAGLNVDNNFTSIQAGNTTGFPDSVILVGAYTTTNDTRFILHGLNNSKLYNFRVICYRTTAISRPMTISYGAATQSIDARNNFTVINLTNLAPSGGDILLDIDFTNGFAFINYFEIQEIN